MNPSLLQLLKVAAPAAPAPPPNPVAAPTVSVTAPGQGTPAPRVTPSDTSGNSANFSETPLTPTAPGSMVSHNGNYIPAEQAQQLQQQEMLAKAEAEKNAPKEQKPMAADTPLTSHLMGSWSARLKAASSPVFTPEKALPHGSVREIPAFNANTSLQAAYNPFDRNNNPGWAGAYAGVMKAVKAPLYRKQHAQAFAGELAKRPDLQYNQRLARRVSEMAETGSNVNPLWALGANLLGSFMGPGAGQQVTNQIQQQVQ